MEQINWTWI